MGNMVQAFGDDALGDLDAVALARRLSSGEVTPVEVTEAAIARVRAVDPDLHAVAHEAFDRALAEARSIRVGDGRPFAGVPSFIKDNNDVAGMPTRHGSAAITGGPARHTIPAAKQFLAQGYVVLGKTTMPEFGLTASTEFADGEPTRNPWDTDRSAGASSGGAAALVAAGAVPIAHANDGGGSIRIPAAANGLVGLKPTRARLLDQPGVRQLPINLVSEGVVSRTVRDTAHHIAAMERTYRNKSLPLVGLVEGPHKRRLRIGLARVSPSGAPVAEETIAQTEETAELLASLGHHVQEVTLPADSTFAADFTLYWSLAAVLMSTANKATHRKHFDRSRLDPFTRGLIAHWGANKGETLGATRRLRAARAQYDAMFDTVDVVLSPTLNHPTPLIGHMDPNLPYEEMMGRLSDYIGFTPVNNICGGPGISLPAPLGESGLPGAIHLSAAWGAERTLLEVAYELEAARPFPDIRERTRSAVA